MSNSMPQDEPMTTYSFNDLKNNKAPKHCYCIWLLRGKGKCILNDKKCEYIGCNNFQHMFEESTSYGNYAVANLDNDVLYIPVKHKIYGIGFIKSIWKDKIHIQFFERGAKDFLMDSLLNKNVFTYVDMLALEEYQNSNH